MKLRQNQADMLRIVNEIIAGSPVKNIIVSSYPGTGKSTIPIIAGKLITAKLADKIAWICPRLSLQDQGERLFLDPFFRQMFNHNLTIRSSTNEHNPSRNTAGWIGTYQALMMDSRQIALNDFLHRRYILVLDEAHHAEAEDGSWTKSLVALYEHAAFRVLMSGTMCRGDGKKIAFTPYRECGGGAFLPCMEGSEDTAVIEYSRADALRERAILPVSFFFSNGVAKWQKLSGKVVEASIATAKDQSHALFTALNTEYAEELLSAAIDHWANYRAQMNRGAKLLVVCASIKDAKRMHGKLRDWGHRAEIATSEDGKDAQRAIKAYKSKAVDILVSVAMASEGLDCPAISHIACLTNVRSYPWITQMVARAVRVDPAGGPYETQRAYVFAPSDALFREIAAKIEADQTAPALVTGSKKNGAPAEILDGGFDLEGGVPRTPGGITPLSSRLTGYDELPLFGGGGPIAPQPLPAQVAEIKTNRERETELRAAIDNHISKYAYQNRYSPKKFNAELYGQFGPRAQMTISQLEDVLAHVRAHYPLTYIRGTGIRRVSTKAQHMNVAWK